jgi:type IV fimbrial biogenesis protein FimT
MRQVPAGFSLYELLLALLLIAVLGGIAVPSFATIVANGRIRAEIDALFHAVHLARKESIMRRTVVSICPSTDSHDCSAKLDWSSGWIMFNNLDRDEPPRLDPGEAVLQVHRGRPHVRIIANRRGFTLRATSKRATNGTLVVCDYKSRATARALVISYTGRPRVAIEDRRGKPYSCTD